MSEIEIIMGLKSSGKTLFLNSYVNMRNLKNEKVLIILVEEGRQKININNEFIKVKKFDSVFEINENKLLYLINIHNPDIIFIEGDYLSIKHIDKILNGKLIRDKVFISSRINIINSKYLSKVINYNVFKINSNIIIINNFNNLDINNNDLYLLKNRNLNAFVFSVKSFDELYCKFVEYKLLKNDFYKNIFKYIKDFI